MAYTYDELQRKMKSENASKNAAYRDRDRYKALSQKLQEENARLTEELRTQGGPGKWALNKLIEAQSENAKLKKYIMELEAKHGLQEADNR